MKETKRCPRCNAKMLNGIMNCHNCGLNFSKLKQATNKEAHTALKNREYDRIIYTTELPNDLSYKNLLLSVILGGIFGAHKFYTGKVFWGIVYCLITSFSMIIIGLQTFNIVANTTLFYNLYTIFSVLWAILILIVLTEITLVIFKKYRVPVALPYKD